MLREADFVYAIIYAIAYTNQVERKRPGVPQYLREIPLDIKSRP